jgi:MoxR-like ATPase
LVRAAQAHALLAGRRHVSPDDIQAVAVPSLAHRLGTANGPDITVGSHVVADVLTSVAVPRP